jgi:hypothetical protein
MSRTGKRRRTPTSSKRVGLVRYHESDWARWLELVDDPDKWEESYAEWSRNSQQAADRLARAGLEIIWVDVDPDEFSQWCRGRSIQNDSEARSRYAAEQIGNLPKPSL